MHNKNEINFVSNVFQGMFDVRVLNSQKNFQSNALSFEYLSNCLV